MNKKTLIRMFIVSGFLALALVASTGTNTARAVKSADAVSNPETSTTAPQATTTTTSDVSPSTTTDTVREHTTTTTTILSSVVPSVAHVAFRDHQGYCGKTGPIEASEDGIAQDDACEDSTTSTTDETPITTDGNVPAPIILNAN